MQLIPFSCKDATDKLIVIANCSTAIDRNQAALESDFSAR
jgi:hypothetical protein